MENRTQTWLQIVGIYLVAAAIGGFAIQAHMDMGYLARQIGKLNGRLAAPANNPQAPRPAADQDTDIDVEPYLNDSDPSWGPKDAKVSIIEFSDYQCPFCKRFHEDAYKQIKAAYGDKVRFVFKHFPLRSIHPHADGAAAAAECANKQGKFWGYNDRLFANQSNLDADALIRYGEQEGLRMDQFKACMASEETSKKVDDDLNGGVKMGITGTPGFIIAGTKISGAQPFANFKQVIDDALTR